MHDSCDERKSSGLSIADQVRNDGWRPVMTNPILIPQLLNRLRMRQVALILAVGEHGTLRKASAELGMTQPAATKMIQELESALGQRLFERVEIGRASCRERV